MSSSVCEDAAPGSGSLFDIINKFACDLATLILATLGITSNINIQNTEEDLTSQQNQQQQQQQQQQQNYQNHQTFNEFYEEFTTWLAFDDFQIQLFKVFTFILVSNVALIFVAWHVYGNRISERFMKPATSAAVEELRKSVSRLKLPKEHSPRV